MSIRTSLFAIAAIYGVHWGLVYFLDVYSFLPWFDMPMHAIGGFTVGILGVGIHHKITDKHHLSASPLWYHILFVVSFVILIAVAWEFHEYVLDQTVGKWNNLPPHQLSLSDTMSDLLLGGVGGFVSALVFRRDW